MRPRIAALAILLAVAVALAPPASAHGGLFLCARLSLGDDGRVALELTADHDDNPNISDAEEARRVLRDALSLCLGDRRVPLEHLGVLRFESRERYGDDSPLPPAADPGPHHLVVAHWQARLPGQRIAFAAKDDTPLDVVLWRAGERAVAGRSRWTLLIAGERTPLFATTPAADAGSPAAGPGLAAFGIGLAVATLGLGLRFLRRRLPLDRAAA